MYAAFNAMASGPKHRTTRAGLDARPRSVGAASPERITHATSKIPDLRRGTPQIPAAGRVAQHPAPAKLSRVVTRQRVLAAVGLLEISDFGLTAPAAHGEADRARDLPQRASLYSGSVASRPARPAPESLRVTWHLARLCQEIPAKTSCRPSKVKTGRGSLVRSWISSRVLDAHAPWISKEALPPLAPRNQARLRSEPQCPFLRSIHVGFQHRQVPALRPARADK
jgi:hypothetical protein